MNKTGYFEIILKAFCSTALALSIISQASAEEVTNAPIKGALCTCNAFSGDESVFTCGTIGRATIPQIYEKGWRIVIANLPNKANSFGSLIIEEQR